MRHAIEHIPVARADTAEVRGTVTLAFADRHRRRIRLNDDAGEAFLLDLPHAVRLADGDRLRLADGGVIVVRAADEPVLTVTVTSPVETAKLAWHIGNRHTPVQVLDDGRLRIIDDHVMRDMIIGLGGVVVPEIAPFDPLNGAYHGLGSTQGQQGHRHSHSHGPDHHDQNGPGHVHAHIAGNSHDHG